MNATLRRRLMPLAVIALVGGASAAHAGGVFDEIGRSVTKGAHQAGRTIERGAHQTGAAIKKGAHDVGRAFHSPPARGGGGRS